MSANIAKEDRFPPNMHTPKRSWKQRLAAFIIILAIVAVGVGVRKYLLVTRPVAHRKPPVKLKTLVTTRQVSPVSTNVTVKGFGTVIPAQEINLQARVAGTVEYLHPDFVPGGIIKKGEVVVRLDDTDYQLNLQNKLDGLAQAEAELRIEEGNQKIARQEWELIGKYEDLDTSSSDLALRKPQLEKVKANISAAKTEVQRARVDLDRTVIKAPFNAMVREKKTDIGSQVTSQSTIGVLTGIDTFWAEISLPVEKLEWIDMPGKTGAGSPVKVYGSSEKPYRADIVKLLPDIDTDGLMARLLIAVRDPMQLKGAGEPMLLGSFVRAEISGKQLENVYEVPRASLKDDNYVLTVTPDDKLHIQPVSVIWRNTDYVFVDKGLETGDRIIVSNVAAPIEGMALEMTTENEDAETALVEDGKNETGK